MVRKFFKCASYDLKAIEEYLSEMAAKGFMFVKWNNTSFYFVIIELVWRFQMISVSDILTQIEKVITLSSKIILQQFIAYK